LPFGEESGDAVDQVGLGGKGVEHVALGFGGKEKLLIVLAVDVGEQGGEFPEQGSRHRPAADKGARFAAGEDFALDEQLSVFGFEAGGVEQAADRALVAHFEDTGHASAGFAGANHVGGCAPAEQEAQGVDDDRLAAARLAGQQVQAGVELHS